MGVKEAFRDIVRVLVFIDMLMVNPVVGGPIQGGILEGSRAEKEDEEFHRPLGLEGDVRKEAVVAQGDAKAGGVVIENEHRPDERPALHLARITCGQVILIPEEPRYHGQRQQGRTNQENGGDPFDTVDREIPKHHTCPDCGAESAEARRIEAVEKRPFRLFNITNVAKTHQKMRFPRNAPH